MNVLKVIGVVAAVVVLVSFRPIILGVVIIAGIVMIFE